MNDYKMLVDGRSPQAAPDRLPLWFSRDLVTFSAGVQHVAAHGVGDAAGFHCAPPPARGLLGTGRIGRTPERRPGPAARVCPVGPFWSAVLRSEI
jgi:hypothetical protein